MTDISFPACYTEDHVDATFLYGEEGGIFLAGCKSCAI
jgi:hypothetical protein